MKSLLLSFLSWWTWFLTFTSGFANLTTIILYNTSVTHHTGNISRLPLELFYSTPSNFSYLLKLIFCFFIGSVLSGILFHDQKLIPKKRYGILLIFLGLFLLMIYFTSKDNYILYTIAFMSGCQNAMFLYVKNHLARTSHLTGYLTDTGVALGRMLVGYHKDYKNFLFNFSQIVFFSIGGILAAVICNKVSNLAVPMISFLYILAGTIYFIFRSNHFFSSSYKD